VSPLYSPPLLTDDGTVPRMNTVMLVDVELPGLPDATRRQP